MQGSHYVWGSQGEVWGVGREGEEGKGREGGIEGLGKGGEKPEEEMIDTRGDGG